MTTIASDGATIACDSRATAEYILQDSLKKIYEIDGGYLGFAGEFHRFEAFLAWFAKGAKPHKFPDICSENCQVLLMSGGKVYRFEESPYPIAAGKVAAIGSGCMYAMGAMLAGASPKEAVSIACKLDVDSAGPIRSYP